MTQNSDLIGSKEAAELTGLDLRTIHRRVERGELPTAGKLPGLRGAYLFNRTDIEALAEKSPLPLGGQANA